MTYGECSRLFQNAEIGNRELKVTMNQSSDAKEEEK